MHHSIFSLSSLFSKKDPWFSLFSDLKGLQNQAVKAFIFKKDNHSLERFNELTRNILLVSKWQTWFSNTRHFWLNQAISYHNPKMLTMIDIVWTSLHKIPWSTLPIQTFPWHILGKLSFNFCFSMIRHGGQRIAN